MGAATPLTVDALAERVRPVMLARDRQLPVLPALESLFPGGALRRGSVVAVGSGADAGPVPGSDAGPSGTTSLALALAAGPSQGGSWVATVGLGSLGLLAAADLGVALDRLVLVPRQATFARFTASQGRRWQGRSPTHSTSECEGEDAASGVTGRRERRPMLPDEARAAGAPAAIVAALIDGFDVVLVAAGPGARWRAADARRLVARVRERGAVLVTVGGDLPGQPGNVRLTVTASRWEGLGEEERGYLRRRRVSVAASGRGEASRPRRAELWLPTEKGELAPRQAVLAPEVVALTPTSGARTRVAV
jgi:putative intracellular protease/amidase